MFTYIGHVFTETLRLNVEDLGKVLQKLDTLCPDCLVKKLDSGEVDVNVDLITGIAFKHINTMVDEISPDVQVTVTGANRRSITNINVKQ